MADRGGGHAERVEVVEPADAGALAPDAGVAQDHRLDAGLGGADRPHRRRHARPRSRRARARRAGKTVTLSRMSGHSCRVSGHAACACGLRTFRLVDVSRRVQTCRSPSAQAARFPGDTHERTWRQSAPPDRPLSHHGAHPRLRGDRARGAQGGRDPRAAACLDRAGGGRGRHLRQPAHRTTASRRTIAGTATRSPRAPTRSA